MGLKLPTWEELSKDEQIPILNLPLNKNYVIIGDPGTGKTICALHRASRWKKANSGKKTKVLFLVYNVTLMQYLTDALKEIKLEYGVAKTYHSWFYKLYFDLTKEKVPQIKKYNPDWAKVDQGLNNKLNNYKIQYLLLDEAQDFPVELLRLLNSISQNATVFCDTQQAMNDTNTTTADITNAFEADRKVYYLTKNFRNTKEIFDVARVFYPGDAFVDQAAKTNKSGDKPQLIKRKDFEEVTTLISNVADNNVSLSIGVIIPDAKKLKLSKYHEVLKRKSEANVQVYGSGMAVGEDEFSFENDGIKIISYKTAKGLEFDIVFLPEIDNEYFDEKSGIKIKEVYVASTRAKDKLYYVYTKETNSFVIKALKENPDIVEISEIDN